MDLTDISKVASRKRMNNDAEKLREKVSRETAKIIKLKVAQDTAYWDLKEKLQQLEANHERLQQNMVEVQMQHEAISGQYQEELRLRPDTLNKLSGTRHICDVLEEYGSRLRRGVARCRADQQALGAAYGKCGARVRQQQAAAQRERAAAARRLARLQAHLAEARDHARAGDAQRRAAAERLERAQGELRRSERTASALEADAARLLRERDEHAAELRRVVTEQAAEIEELRKSEVQALTERRAGAEREDAARQELEAARRRLHRLLAERAETHATVDQFKTEVSSLADDKKRMEKLVDERNERVATLKSELGLAKDRLAREESARLEVETALRSLRRQLEARTEAADELAGRVRDLERAAGEAQAAADCCRAAAERRAEELRALVAERERELDDKARTIARLMADLKAEAEAHARADGALGVARRQHEAERAELAAALSRLEGAARAKDDEIGAQLGVIMDLRAERERLLERVHAGQATIDNIQKELTGRAPPPPPPGERDETPKAARDSDALFGFLSDGSVDGDALDAREVGRRFEALTRGARGELPLHTMRPQGTLSLSQVKKDLKMKSRAIFKNKRVEKKLKE